MIRSEIKALARAQIRGNILTLLLCSIISAVLCSAIPGVSTVLLAPVFTYGAVLNHMAMHRGEKATVERIFDGLHRFVSVWCLYFLMGLFVFLWSLLFLIPGIVKAYAYSLAPYILADNPEMTALEAIRASREMTRGHKGELFALELSFLGWIFLSIFTCGIALIWVIPYMDATMANAYEAIKQQHRR